MHDMKSTLALIIFTLSCKIAISQIYLVPGAQIQPSWVFPLWFEDGSGAKDTLFFCFDPNAQTGPPLDTLYGEKRTAMDTSKFNVYFDCTFTSDFQVLKVSVKDASDLYKPVCVWHAYMPLTIKWDKNLFYSDSIPFTDQDPAPRAKGGFYFDAPTISLYPAPNCYGPILMTDSVIMANCYASDSIILGEGFSIMSFEIGPWDGLEWLGSTLNDHNENVALKIFPNLIISQFEIVNEESFKYLYKIINMSGELISYGNILPHSTTKISVQNWSDGLYLIYTINQINGRTHSFKLIKPKS